MPIRKLPGRPSKVSTQKFVARNITLPPELDSYILGIIKDRNLSVRGWYARIVAEIISDHQKVRIFKDSEASALREKLALLEPEKT